MGCKLFTPVLFYFYLSELLHAAFYSTQVNTGDMIKYYEMAGVLISHFKTDVLFLISRIQILIYIISLDNSGR